MLMYCSAFTQDDDIYVDSQSNLPSCSEALDSVACIRVDSPKPTSYCEVRDTDSKKCLKAVYFPDESASNDHDAWTFVQGEQPDIMESSRPSSESYYPSPVPASESYYPSPVPEVIEEMLVRIRSAGPNPYFFIFIDADEGNDQSGTGSELRPFRSLRAGLSHWLAPGRCAPFCASIVAGASGTVIVRPGIYWGEQNRNIELLLFDGVNVTVRSPSAASAPFARNTGVEFRIDPPDAADGTADPPPAFLVRADGLGQLSLLGLSVANSSSDAVIMTGDVGLVTDLFFRHGRMGTWAQVQQANGSVVRVPTWDVGADKRFRGKLVCR